MPPVSNAAFQVKPQSFRSIEVVAEKPAWWCPDGCAVAHEFGIEDDRTAYPANRQIAGMRPWPSLTFSTLVLLKVIRGNSCVEEVG